MHNPEPRINKELAPEVFQLAVELYAQKQQEYSLQELIMIGKEAEIPAEFIQQAVELIQARKQESQKVKLYQKHPKLKLSLLGIVITSLTLMVGTWGYNQIFNSKNNSEYPVGILPGEREKNHHSNVERYLLNKEGLVDGLLLNDGKQVKLPPHLNDQIVAAIKPGDTVEVVGKMGIKTVYGQAIEARIVTNIETKAVVTKQRKQKGKKKAEQIDLKLVKIDDSVQHWLVDDEGKIRGIILKSAIQVHLAKHLTKQLDKLAKIDSQIKADGVGRQTANGEVIEVISLDIDGKILPYSK
jgi:hypothetical protein